jgi:DNA-binding transcriptional MerR regulator
MGLTLDEIAEVIPLYFGEQTGVRGRKKMLALLERRLAETEERIEGLAELREELRGAVERSRAALAEPATTRST